MPVSRLMLENKKQTKLCDLLLIKAKIQKDILFNRKKILVWIAKFKRGRSKYSNFLFLTPQIIAIYLESI